MRLLLVFTLFIFLTSCSKPNPNPELMDPVYDLIKKSLDNAKSDQASAKAAYSEHQETLSKVQPQTGQNKYALKRLQEAGDRLNHADQMVKYWEIRLHSRLKFDRETYIVAWTNKQPWPDPKEVEEYKAFMGAEEKSRKWSYESRMAELGMPVKKKGAAAKEGEKDGKKPDAKQEATKESAK